MPILFVPPRGRILICDFDMACVPPEMAKERRAVVISPRVYNTRHGNGPGRCLVVPFSGTPPREEKPCYVEFPVGKYRSLSEPTWAYCDVIASVSHRRLNNVRAAGENLNEQLSDEDMARIENGIRHAVGIAHG